MQDNRGFESPLLRSLRNAPEPSNAPQSSATPSGCWQNVRRHGNTQELATRASSFIKGLLTEDRRGLR